MGVKPTPAHCKKGFDFSKVSRNLKVLEERLPQLLALPSKRSAGSPMAKQLASPGHFSPRDE